MQPREVWQWFLVPLPRGINQLLIEAVLSAGQGNHSGVALDDVIVKPCEHFSESSVLAMELHLSCINPPIFNLV